MENWVTGLSKNISNVKSKLQMMIQKKKKSLPIWEIKNKVELKTVTRFWKERVERGYKAS